MKISKAVLSLAFLTGATLFNSSLMAQPAEVRLAVTPVSETIMYGDFESGLDVAITMGSTLRFVLQARSEAVIVGASLGWTFYSPDNSLTTEVHIENVALIGQWATFMMWDGRPQLDILQVDGVLPDRFLAGGYSICRGCEPNTGGGGFQNPNFMDFVEWTVSFDSSGTFCIDSAFFPPTSDFIAFYPNGQFHHPLWFGGGGDLSVGGTRTEAYCVNVLSQNCCLTPGDVNHSGKVNIADATFLMSRIFANGPPPACCREGDANGDGRMNIADITYMVRRIFAGGPPPVCGGPVDNC